MKPSVKTALGAMCVALSCALMLVTSVIPIGIYAIPDIATLLILFIMMECGKKWALAVYFCTSVISAIIVPEKEAVAIYIALMGYYPVLKTLLDKIKPKLLNKVIKSVFFLAVVTGLYLILIFAFGISSEMLKDTEKFFIPVLYISGLVSFLLHDYLLEILELAYYRKWRKKLRKILRIR